MAVAMPVTRLVAPGPEVAMADADLAAWRGHSRRRHVRGALLVADQDVADPGSRQRVVDRQDRAAGIAEDGVDAFPHQAFPDDLCSRSLHSLLREIQRPKKQNPRGGFPGGLRVASTVVQSQLTAPPSRRPRTGPAGTVGWTVVQPRWGGRRGGLRSNRSCEAGRLRGGRRPCQIWKLGPRKLSPDAAQAAEACGDRPARGSEAQVVLRRAEPGTGQGLECVEITTVRQAGTGNSRVSAARGPSDPRRPARRSQCRTEASSRAGSSARRPAPSSPRPRPGVRTASRGFFASSPSFRPAPDPAAGCGSGGLARSAGTRRYGGLALALLDVGPGLRRAQQREVAVGATVTALGQVAGVVRLAGSLLLERGKAGQVGGGAIPRDSR